MIFVHPLDQDDITFLLFCLELPLSLDLGQSQMFRVRGLFETIPHWTTVPDFEIFHFDSERGLTVDLQHILNKFFANMKLVDIFLLE